MFLKTHIKLNQIYTQKQHIFLFKNSAKTRKKQTVAEYVATSGVTHRHIPKLEAHKHTFFFIAFNFSINKIENA